MFGGLIPRYISMEDCVPDPSGDWTYICDDGSEETSGGGRAKFWSEKCTLVEPEEGNSCPVPQSWHDKFLGIFTTEKFQTKVQAIVNMLELDTAREEERQRCVRRNSAPRIPPVACDLCHIDGCGWGSLVRF